MTIESEFQIWNVSATEDLSGNVLHKAVTISGTIAATPALAIGVLRSKGVVGQQVAAVYKGITKVIVGAAVTTPGYPITITTSGFFIAATAAASGGTLGTGHIGRLLNTAAVASGDLVPALVDFTTKPPYAGV